MFSFAITDRDGSARRGRLNTPHGIVDTPAFMPVGTAGAVKGVTPRQLRDTAGQMILANTYHLQLRPTADVVAKLGGLHRFMGWDGPILTDSGGYQVFSLARLRTISDDGVAFQSHIDGAELRLDPRLALDIQVKLGADVIMVFDHCPSLPCDYETLSAAVDRTIRWAALCKELHRPGRQALFGIVQGGLDLSLRQRCLEAIVDMAFDGYAIGGLSVGETHDEMLAVLGPIASALPANRPRYLMGVGMPRDIVEAVRVGVDMFDCTLPTRNGRNTWAFTAGGLVKLRNEKHRRDDGPLEAGCDCETCQRFSRGYIRHLFNVGEMLGPTLTSIHNLRFYQRLMARIRDLIRAGRLAEIVDEFPIASDRGHQSNYERPP